MVHFVWAKAHGVLTRSHYLWSHEPCFYGWVEGKPPARKPPPGMKTVWQINQVGEPKDLHPTIKPVELFLRHIEYHTEPGDIVYEPFSGSGYSSAMIGIGRFTIGRRTALPTSAL